MFSFLALFVFRFVFGGGAEECVGGSGDNGRVRWWRGGVRLRVARLRKVEVSGYGGGWGGRGIQFLFSFLCSKLNFLSSPELLSFSFSSICFCIIFV